MKKINCFFEKNAFKITLLFLFLGPVIDIITSIMTNKFSISITLGTIVRTLFLLFSIYYVLIICKKNKLSIIYLILIVIYIALFLIYFYLKSDMQIFKYNMNLLIKFWYFPIILLFIYNLFSNTKQYISKDKLYKLFFIYLIFVSIPNLFSFGFSSYLEGKGGASGLFDSANEIGSILAILSPFAIEYILKLKNKILKVILLLIVFISFLSIGTKVPLLSFIIVCFVLFIRKIIKVRKIKEILIYIFVFGVLIIGSIVIIPKTNAYKNILIHLDFLGIENADDLLTNTEMIDRFIYSDRITFLNNSRNYYDNSNLYEKLIGNGYIRLNDKTDSNKKLVELDFYDVFYCNGIIGFILYYLLLLIILIKIIKKIQDRKISSPSYSYVMSILLILGLASFSGHIFVSPSVSLIAVVILVSILNLNNKKELLFCANDLTAGGIEKSLICLLKNINYKKYNVTLLLEHKSGELISEIPKKVKIVNYNVNNNKNAVFRKIINLLKRFKFIIVNYEKYDFSCCYATYSYPANVLSKLGSHNSALYVHSNYKYIYKKDELLKFFNSRRIDKYRKIIFVSNEAKNDLISYYPNIKEKSITISNLINKNEVLELSKEKINIKRTKNKLLVFVGRLEEKSKKITRQIELVKNLKNVDLWIVGDGPDKKLYEKLKGNLENIKMIGYKSNPHPYILLADYIILTSDYEGYPVVYNEAIILNKKIITTIDISDDFITIPNRFGYIISKNQSKMISEVKQILENDKLKLEKVDFDGLNKNKMNLLENIFDEVI